MGKLGIAIDHDTDHGEKHPRSCAHRGAFVVADQTAMLNHPSECSFDNPALGKDVESGFCGDTLDDLDCGRRLPMGNPVGELRATETTVGPDFFESMASKDRLEKFLGSGSLGNIGWRDGHSQQPAEGVDADKSFAALDFLSSIVTHQPAMPAGTHALAVDDPCGGLVASAVESPQYFAQAGIDGLQQTGARPGSKVVIDGLPCGKIFRQQSPRAAAFEHIKHCIEHPPQAGPGSTERPCPGKQGRNDMPLEVRNAGWILSDFHRSKTAARKGFGLAGFSKSTPFQLTTFIFRQPLRVLLPAAVALAERVMLVLAMKLLTVVPAVTPTPLTS